MEPTVSAHVSTDRMAAMCRPRPEAATAITGRSMPEDCSAQSGRRDHTAAHCSAGKGQRCAAKDTPSAERELGCGGVAALKIWTEQSNQGKLKNGIRKADSTKV